MRSAIEEVSSLLVFLLSFECCLIGSENRPGAVPFERERSAFPARLEKFGIEVGAGSKGEPKVEVREAARRRIEGFILFYYVGELRRKVNWEK